MWQSTQVTCCSSFRGDGHIGRGEKGVGAETVDVRANSSLHHGGEGSGQRL